MMLLGPDAASNTERPSLVIHVEHLSFVEWMLEMEMVKTPKPGDRADLEP
jgi:hypothetical protein